MIDLHARRRRRLAAVLALGGVGALVASACVRPRPQPPTTTAAPSTAAPSTSVAPTTAPGHGHEGGGPVTTPPTTAPAGGGYSCGPTTPGSGGAGGGEHGHAGTGEPIHTGGAHNIPARLNHPPTPEQMQAAEALIAATKAAAPQFADYKVAESMGYKSIGDNRSGVAHYINLAKHNDGKIFDPDNVEALVYKTNPGTGAVLELTTFMYVMEPGCTMDNVPDIAGNLTVYHAHDNLCYKKSDPGVLSGILVNGQCFPASEDSHFRPSKPMLHVWLVDNPCGPFAGTDRGNRTGSCTDGH
jgi:hypothetical protein